MFEFPNPFETVAAASGLAGAVVGVFFAVKNHEWTKLIALAVEITKDTATLAGASNAEKRKFAADQLYAAAPAAARVIFKQEQFEQAVEFAWQAISKPALEATP